MIRLIIAAALAVGLAAGTAAAQPADAQNTVTLDTTKGRIVVKLRNDIAP